MDFNLYDLRVINPNLICFSTSQIRVTTTALSFNIAAAIELEYPSHVWLMATPDGKGIAIQAADMSSEMSSLALPFFDENRESKALIQIKDRNFVRVLRKEMQWLDKASRKAPGVLYRKLKLIYFDLTKADRVTGAKSQSQSLSLLDYPRFDEVLSSLRPAPLQLMSAVTSDVIYT